MWSQVGVNPVGTLGVRGVTEEKVITGAGGVVVGPVGVHEFPEAGFQIVEFIVDGEDSFVEQFVRAGFFTQVKLGGAL